MGDITRYSNQGKMVRPKAPPMVGAGSDVDMTEWSGAVVTFDELKVALTSSGSVIAEGVEADGRVLRNRKTGLHYMRRTGWRAYSDHIVVVVSQRDLRAQPDGKFKPEGVWQTVGTTQHRGEGPVKNRVGDVVDDSVNPAMASTQWSDSAASNGTTLAESDRDLSYLPRAVRQGVIQLIPAPTFFHCQAVQYSIDGHPTHHQVSALRMSSTIAVVVLASRQRNASDWQVQQVQYTLAADPVRTAGVPSVQ